MINVRQGDGGGSGFGFRGGRGKPGYPLPDDMKNNIAPDEDVDSVVEDVIADLAERDVFAKQHVDPSMMSGVGDNLDLVVNDVVLDLVSKAKERAFFALKIPQDIGKRIVVPGGEKVEDLHVTLLYVKNLGPGKKELAKSIADRMSQGRSFVTTLGGFGRFSSNENTDGKDVIYVSVDSPELSKFRRELANELEKSGIEPDVEHGYTPHVSVKFIEPTEVTPVDRLNPIEDILLKNFMFESVVIESGEKTNKPMISQKEEEINNVVEENKQLLEKHGYVISKELGSGSNGIAFLMKNGKVLKVTTDDSEARSSNQIKGKDLKHVAKIFDVFKLRSDVKRAGPRKIEFYGIVQEYLKPLGMDVKTDLSNNITSMRRFFTFDWPLKTFEELDSERKSLYDEQDRKKSGEAFDAMERYGIFDMFEELKSHGIEWYDLHTDNLMMRGGEVVAIDLGVSDSSGAEPPMLESGEKGIKLEGSSSNIDEKESRMLLKTFRGIINSKRGITVPEELTVIGKGSRGVAFDMGGGKALKVTRDVSEAEASNKIKNKSTKHVVRVFDVFQLRNTGVYCIVQEKLSPIPGSKANTNDDPSGAALKLDQALGNSGFYGAFERATGGIKKWADIEKSIFELLKTRKDLVGDENGAELSKDVDESIKLLKKFDIDKMVDEIASLGIEFADYHSGNIMKRGGDYVLIDLGYSKSGNPGKIDVLESKIIQSICENVDVTSGKTLNEVSLDTARNLLLSRSEPIGKRIGVKISKYPKVLGIGTQGVAFDVGRGKVLKITSDKSEALSSNKIKGKSTKHVVRVFDVFNVYSKDGTNLYAILQEKLTPFKSGIDKLNSALRSTGVYDIFEKKQGEIIGWKEVQDAAFKLLHIKKSNVGTEKANEISRDFIEELNILKQFNVDKMIDELASLDIEFADYHAGNIMKRGADYVLIDLGYSNPGNVVEPDVLESKKKKVDEAKTEDPVLPDQALKKYGGLLKKHGMKTDVSKNVGEGSNGAVYDLGGGKVLKLTSDVTEVKASNHVKGKTNAHIVKVFDAFSLPSPGSYSWYGVVQEKLTPLTENDKLLFDASVKFIYRNFMGGKLQDVGNIWSLPWDAIKKTIMENTKDDEELSVEAPQKIDVLERMQWPEIMSDLKKNKIDYLDVHSGNIMKRGSDYVLTDLGGKSKSPGKKPDAIESLIRETLVCLSERVADKVGVTVGRFQPFHKGHAAVIRDLAKKFDRVIVLVAGNNSDGKNPFSYDLRLDMMKKSLPDVFSKLEVHRAEFEGKGSGYIPGVLSDVVKNEGSTIDPKIAVNIVVGQDRLESVKKQLEHAVSEKESGKVMFFDPSMATVEALKDVKNDDDAGRISGTNVRKAISNDDEESVRKMMDDHLTSNEQDFEDVYERMKKELGGEVVKEGEEKINELLSDIGGEQGVQNILDANADRLLATKWKINVKGLKKLGSGQDGVAFKTSDNKVLKVTSDKKEAETCYSLVGRSKPKFVVHILDVFKFADTMSDKGVYGIVTELLTPLSDSEKKEFDNTLVELQTQMGESKYINDVWSGDFERLLSDMKATFEDDMSKESQLPPGHPRLKKALDFRMNRYATFFKKFKIDEMMKELKKLDINFADYHANNLMKRGNDYVINDLGRSMSLSGGYVPKLESFVEGIVNEIGAFTGPGNSQLGLRAGSTGFSAPKSRVDPNSKEQWQNQLSSLQQLNSGSVDFNEES